MWLPAAGVKVFLAAGATDMRKSIDGLSLLVSQQLAQDPFSGHLFVFCNRRRNLVKVLYWDRHGFCLWQKRLERRSFRWPGEGGAERALALGCRELLWLLEGLEVRQRGAYGELRYSALA